MTDIDFDDLFNSFRHTVARLEALPAYSVGGAEAERIAALRDRRARPERNVRTDPWLARIALTTLTENKVWERYRVVDNPMTEYQLYQVESQKEAQACGEVVHIVARAELDVQLGPDFWLFDAGREDQHAAVMRYDPDGRFLGTEVTHDVAGLIAILEAVKEQARPLNEFLARIVDA